MAQEIINIGPQPNDGQGDNLRTAFDKTNENFDQIWTAGPVGSNVRIAGNVISTLQVNQDLALSPNGVGNVRLNNNTIPGANNTWFLGSVTNRWRGLFVGNVNAGNITINDGLNVPGNVTIGGNLTVQGNIIEIGNITTDSLTLQLANTALTDAAADGAGITVGANDDIATFLYDAGNNVWTTNIGLQVGGPITGTSISVSDATIYGNIDAINGNFTGNVTANYFFGDGSQLTGMYGNANVTNFLANGFGSNSVVTTGNITAGYFLGNGSQLTGIQTGAIISNTAPSLGNGGIWWNSVDGRAYVKYANAFIDLSPSLVPDPTTYVGNVSFDDITVTNVGNIIPAANAVYSLGSEAFQWSNLWVANNTIYLGGVPVGITAANVLTVGGEEVLSNNSAVSITTSGNIEAAYIYGDTTEANVFQGGTANISGNVTANYFIGDGSQLTGLPPGYTDSDVATFLAAYGSNTISTTGNITAGNFIGSGSNVELIAQSSEWVFDTTGNLVYPDGTVSTGGAIYAAANASVQMISNNAYNQVQVDDSNVYIYTSLNGISLQEWKFTGSGNLTVPGNIIMPGGASLLGDGSSPAPSVSGFASVSAVTLTASGNVNANIVNMSGGAKIINNTSGGIQLIAAAGGTVRLSSDNDNNFWILGTDGRTLLPLVTVNGSSGGWLGSNGNLNIEALGKYWQFGSSGNLTLPGNTFAVNYANGVAVSLGGNYGNANVVANLAALGANPISSAANITTTGNVSGAYVLGNGSQLTSVNAVTVDVTNTNGLATTYYPTFVENRTTAQIARADVDLSYRTDTNTLTVGNISSGGNITAAYFIGNGSALTGVTVNTVGNITGTSSNVDIIAGAYQWTFNNTGNLVLPGNTFTVNYANGTAVSLGGGGGSGTVTNVQGAGTVSGITLTGNVTTTGNLTLGGTLDLSSVSGNITTSGNISGGYILGNGSQLTGLPASYGNSNVVTLLSSFGSNTISTTGNVTAGNLITTGNVSGNVNGFAIGYRDIPVLSLAANTTVSTSDAGKQYYSTSASALTLTIANNASQAFQTGATINIVNQGAGNVSVLRGVGVTMYLAGNSTSSDRTLTSYGVASVTKVATDTWFISGVGLV